MAENKGIATARIDPKSTVNVRKSQVEEGVEKLKSSIAEHGFWERNPIVIRPHPDSSSKYEYEIVVGQCRLRACSELGIEQIPAVIEELHDDDAIRLSWDENESRSDLTMVDKVFWADFYFQKYRKQGKNKGESCARAAKHLGANAQTIRKYLPLAILPDDVVGMVDNRKLRIGDAGAIAESCVDAESDEEFEQKIRERVEWFIPLDKRHKEAAPEVLKDVGAQASIKDLDNKLAGKVKNVTFEVTIPEGMRLTLKKWGDDNGMIGASESLIGSKMITDVLSGK